MGYPVDPEDLPTFRLLQIVADRKKAVMGGYCPYCRLSLKDDLIEHTCKYANSMSTFHPMNEVDLQITLSDSGVTQRVHDTSERVRPVLQPWVMQLGLRHQGVLLSAIRGCDTLPKEHVAKWLQRIYRGLILVSFDPNPSSFIFPWARVDERTLMNWFASYRGDLDHLPQHYCAHFMHAVQIVGAKHPDGTVRALWGQFYVDLCRGLHVIPESVEAMDARLNAPESEHARNQVRPVEADAVKSPYVPPPGMHAADLPPYPVE